LAIFSAQSKHYKLSIVNYQLFGRAGGINSPLPNSEYRPPSGYPLQVLAALRAFRCYPSRKSTKKKETRIKT